MPDTPLREKRLLVVDDNPVNVELLLDLLEDQGFENAAGLEDPREVLDHCRARRPDLILLDLRMPHLDGYAVIAQLKDAFGDQAPAVIVLTAQADDATRRRVLAQGVHDIITKPFDYGEVLQRIRNALHLEHRFATRSEQADRLQREVEARTRELERLSRTDPITGLPNRRELTRHLREWQHAGLASGALFIAIDDLRDVVQLHGHTTAERLLKALAEVMRPALPERALLGIWGGGGLLVIVRAPASEAALEALARKLLARLEREHGVEDLRLTVRARVGIGQARSVSPERLAHMAALALPPMDSGQRLRHHCSELERLQRERLQLQHALRGAAGRNELSLVYQPKLTLGSRETVGAEALLRWHHPRLGTISPGRFIPLAEATGDILDFGDWVLETALTQLGEWRARGAVTSDFSLAVNVAPRQLCRPDFAEALLGRLDRLGLPHHCLSIEVTESGLMADVDQARRQLRALADAGIGIGVDDFGTGYSSLAYLKTLPLSLIKIDRAFVMDLVDDPEARHLATTITRLAHGLGFEVIAEGIEEEAQARLLEAMGCPLGQGYLFARPLPAADFLAWYGRQAVPGHAP
ncbi:putative bifunctional diguanylate cyclase/phosphodiesterase [Halomonas beimenensis]|uniref:Diguanylate cyclase n=1 Tax=Halomonas beimenensis TaxID=475662 RepID=A0A291PCN0_9GAMM|nr:EAL domain-containing protein [Halomonas beimenensis]ATJ84615.1 diguanylate cyclase [Halomonas beimenensis]